MSDVLSQINLKDVKMTIERRPLSDEQRQDIVEEFLEADFTQTTDGISTNIYICLKDK